MKFICYVLVTLFGFFGSAMSLVFLEHLAVAGRIEFVPLGMGVLFLIGGAHFLKKARGQRTETPKNEKAAVPLENR